MLMDGEIRGNIWFVMCTSKWEDNIKADRKEIGLQCVDRVHLVPDWGQVACPCESGNEISI